MSNTESDLSKGVAIVESLGLKCKVLTLEDFQKAYEQANAALRIPLGSAATQQPITLDQILNIL